MVFGNQTIAGRSSTWSSLHDMCVKGIKALRLDCGPPRRATLVLGCVWTDVLSLAPQRELLKTGMWKIS